MYKGIYRELLRIEGDLKFDEEILEMIILNNEDKKVNRYLKEAATEIRHALSDLSDADFEVSTTPGYDD